MFCFCFPRKDIPAWPVFAASGSGDASACAPRYHKTISVFQPNLEPTHVSQVKASFGRCISWCTLCALATARPCLRYFFAQGPRVCKLRHSMQLQLQNCTSPDQPILNILAFGCWTDEDYIGRISRLSRRVQSQRLVVQRVMTRSLMLYQRYFKERMS